MIGCFLLIVSADTPPTQENLQKTLIGRVFRTWYQRERIYLMSPPQDIQFKDEKGTMTRRFQMNFEEGTLKILKLWQWWRYDTDFDRSLMNLHIAWLPQTIRNLEVRICGQRYPFRTRMLPRDAERIDFRINRIFGSIHLCDLPRRVERFYIGNNSLSGKITFVNLPETMTEIHLNGNRFDQSYVLYGALPLGLTRVNIYENKHKIRKCVPISKDLKLDDRRIFEIDRIY